MAKYLMVITVSPVAEKEIEEILLIVDLPEAKQIFEGQTLTLEGIEGLRPRATPKSYESGLRAEIRDGLMRDDIEVTVQASPA